MLPYRDSRLIKILLIVFFTIVVGYALFEGRGLLFGPTIMIDTRVMEVSDKFIRIEGKAERIASLSMNGQPISVTEAGEFSEPFVLIEGYNRITLNAKDRFGKSTERVLEIVYTPTATTSLAH